MSAFLDYYRCPPDLAPIGTQPQLSAQEGYFKFGDAVGVRARRRRQPGDVCRRSADRCR